MQNKFPGLIIYILIFGATRIYSASAVEYQAGNYICEATGFVEGYKGQIYQKKFTARGSNLENAKNGVLVYCQHSAFECSIVRCVKELPENFASPLL